jgi:hypothetical protein
LIQEQPRKTTTLETNKMKTNWLRTLSMVALCGAIFVGGLENVEAQEISPLLISSELSSESVSNEVQGIFDDCGCRPGTLLQWSRGNSFGGGPDLDSPLVTDRPDFTEASSTVGLGVAQLEIGYTYTYDNDGTSAVKSHSFPEPLLRYGILAEWLELRVGWNMAEQRTNTVGSSTTLTGSEDLYLGFKIALTPQECWLPEMALIPQMTVPTASAAFANDQVLPGVNWLYGWELNNFVSMGGSSQFNRALDPGTSDNYLEFAQSWTFAYSLTDCIGAFTEWYAFFPSGADTAKPQHVFNGGFTYLLTNNVQFDVRAGLGLNEAADDYLLGTGLSIRF